MKKQGKKIKQTSCVLPLGMKRGDFELAALNSITAMELGVFKDDHLAHLMVLAEMCNQIKHKPPFIISHVKSLRNQLIQIHDSLYLNTSKFYESVKASTNILLDFIVKQNNKQIIDIATKGIKQIGQ